MTSKEKVDTTKNVILGLLDLPDLNPVHREYLNSLLFRIETEIQPYSSSIPDEAINLLFIEVLKSSSVVLFTRKDKPASCRITKKIFSKFFPEDSITFEGFEKLKESRYGMTVLGMNINQFFKLKDSGRKEK